MPVLLGPIQVLVLAFSIIGLILGLVLPPKWKIINILIDVGWIGMLIASVLLGFTF
jgi:hypothetical protein